MKLLSLIIIILLATIIITISPSFAQQQQQGQNLFRNTACISHDRAMKNLKNIFGEDRIAIGVTDKNPPQLMQLFLNKERGTFTITLTLSINESLPTCLVISGRDFEINDDRIQARYTIK